MKGLKKLALATAVAAAPFAQAELTSIDDSVLSEMTGQAGISIELSANVGIGSVVYTDTDGAGVSATSGSLELNTIALGGKGTGAQAGTVDGALDQIKIDIDVDGNDGLIIHLGGTNVAGVLTGAAPVDFGLSVGNVAINDGSAVLASNIYVAGNLGPIDVTIANDSTIGVEAFFQVTEGSLNVDVMGMGISNLTIGDNSNPFMTHANSDYAANALASVEAGDFAGANDGVAAVSVTLGDLSALDADTDGFISTAEFNGAGITDVASADTVLAGGSGALTLAASHSAIGGVSNMAFAAMTIATADTSYTDQLGATTVVTQALDITVDAMAMDIAMDISLGGNGIGNVAINDLDLSGTTLKIYGH